MVTISTKISLPDEKVAEAKRDLELLNDPRHLITYQDGYYAQSLVRKYGMSTTDLAALVKAARKRR